MATATTNKVQGPVKFGINALFHPTPETAKIISRAVLYGAAILNFIMLTFPHMSPEIKATVGEYSSFVTGFIYFFCHMFGVEPQAPPTYTKEGFRS